MDSKKLTPGPIPQVCRPSFSLTAAYEPEKFETEIYNWWDQTACFQALDQAQVDQKSFSICLPPPNVTGALHMGHALTNTIQDILIRWRRMLGDNTLWLPGTDHAGIATQLQVEKSLTPGTSRHDLGRERFLEKVWQWKEKYGSEITQQMRQLGSSLDWTRERFTLDAGLSRAVREAFVRLYEEGLIYQGERISNWCVRCQTALSDLEVIPQPRSGHFWHLLYRVLEKDGSGALTADGSPLFLSIATTRPETLLGDTAVAVHPEDERYKFLHGKQVQVPLVARSVPIITDSYVDPSFGSGVLKVTPAHDFNDYELGLKHALPLLSVIDKDGLICGAEFLTQEPVAELVGLKLSEARERIIEYLLTNGQCPKIEVHSQQVGVCQRCSQVVEPLISKQWFLKVESLARPAMDAVREGRVEFIPATWEKTYFEWMDNIRDWCISRQLWWGHQIPAWTCSRCLKVSVARELPRACLFCKAPSASLIQEEDVLDTWFSSALWPFSSLGWPEQTLALKTFYPTSVLETGFDILFFWVARMLMFGLHFTGQVPFRQVYLHAMVRDEKGEKMSKTRGNVVNPLELISRFGADPLRFSLAIMAGQGRDLKLSIERIEGYRGFCNKLWNATHFVLRQYELSSNELIDPSFYEKFLEQSKESLSSFDLWILSCLNRHTAQIQKNLELFELNHAAQCLYDFIWKEYCDWYIEFTKPIFREGSQEAVRFSLCTLLYVLERSLHLLHPFMPFVTEQLYQVLFEKIAKKTAKKIEKHSLSQSAFPRSLPQFLAPQVEEEVAQLQALIDALRSFRGENQISPKVPLQVEYKIQVKNQVKSKDVDEASIRAWLTKYSKTILSLARLSSFKPVSEVPVPSRAQEKQTIISLNQPPICLFIDLEGLVRPEEERQRLLKELKRVASDMEHVKQKLDLADFREKAPAALVEKEKQRLHSFQEKRQQLELALKRLQS